MSKIQNLSYPRIGLALCVLLLASGRFFNLGTLEVQAWDEAMYAMRARAILQFGVWLDQSAYAVQGLYSAAHPPLYIWLTALTMHFLGDHAFSLRLWSAIFGALTVLLVSRFSRDATAGFFAAVTLGTCAFFTFYSRQGQLDVAYTFLLMVGLFCWQRFEDQQQRSWLYGCGVVFGLALMTKIIVGLFLPLSIGLYLLARIGLHQREVGQASCLSTAWKQLAIVIVIGLILAAPWHIFMLAKHKMAFVDYYLLFHIWKRSLVGVEANVPTLGAAFFINQLIVILPIGLAIAISRIKPSQVQTQRHLLLLWCSVLVPFLIFTIAKTKLRSYTIPMLPPLALLAGYGFTEIWRANKVTWPTPALSILFAAWASGQAFRDQARSLIVSTWSELLIIGIFVGIALILIVLKTGILLIKKNDAFSKNVIFELKIGRVFVIVALMCLFGYAFFPAVETYQSGLPQLAARFKSQQNLQLIYMDTASLPQPQLAWYFDGANLNWPGAVPFRHVLPAEADSLTLVPTQATLFIFNIRHPHDAYQRLEERLQSRARTVLATQSFHAYYSSP